MFGHQVVAATLRHHSDAPVFGLLGNANMHIADALAELGDDRLVHVRHEGSAVAMADGYARVSGEVGVSTLTCGPGLTHAATSLIACARGRSPQVVIVGDTPSRDPSRLQTMDQAAFAAACESGFVRVTHPDEVPAAMQEAFVRARVESRAVLLSVPQDVQQEESSFLMPEELEMPAAQLPSGRGVPAASEIDELARSLIAAERPVLIAGRGAQRSAVADLVRQVADHVGGLLATSLPAKGLFLDDPWDIGVSGAFASAPGERLMVNADVVLGVGASLGYYTTEGQLLYPDAAIYRIDERADVEGMIDGHRLILGDAELTLVRLLSALREMGPPRVGYRTQETAALLGEPWPTSWPEPASDGVDPRALMQALAPYVPADARIVVGGGHFWAFPIMYLPGTPANDWLFSYEFGSIGQTLAVAIGAWFAERDRPLVMFDGDGSLLQHIQELDTVVRHGIPMVVIVGNDGGFGSEVHKLLAAGMHDEIVSFPTPDFAAIATAFGGAGHVVRDLADLAPSVREISDPPGLLVLDVRVSRTLASDPYRRLHYGEDNRAPRLSTAQTTSH